MPECENFSKFQTKSDDDLSLYKTSFPKRDTYITDDNLPEDEYNPEDILTFDSYITTHERSIIDMLKESMLQDIQRERDYTQLLKEQIEYLKNEIIHKNLVIECLRIKIRSRNRKHVETTSSVCGSCNGIYDDEESHQTNGWIGMFQVLRHRWVRKGSYLLQRMLAYGEGWGNRFLYKYAKYFFVIILITPCL